ncbi:protein of unknown function [Streptomyces murinus]
MSRLPATSRKRNGTGVPGLPFGRPELSGALGRCEGGRERGRKCWVGACPARVITSSESLAFACTAQPTVATLLLSVQSDGSGQ